MWQSGLLNMCVDGAVTAGPLPAEGTVLLTCAARELEEERLWKNGDV